MTFQTLFSTLETFQTLFFTLEISCTKKLFSRHMQKNMPEQKNVDKWHMSGMWGHHLNMSWAVPFWKEPTPGSVHQECIRLRGCGGWERSWHMCQKRSQPDGSDLSVSVRGWGKGSVQLDIAVGLPVLLSLWEAGPLPSYLSSWGRQGWQWLGDVCCS